MNAVPFRAILFAVAVCLPPAASAQSAPAQQASPTRIEELIEWAESAYQTARVRAAAARDAEVRKSNLELQREKELEAIRACREAVWLDQQIRCIAQRSDAFESSNIGRRFEAGEARFKVLARLEELRQRRQAAAAQPHALPDLMKRVNARCIPRIASGSKCGAEYAACGNRYGTGPSKNAAAWAACLEKIEHQLNDEELAPQNVKARPMGGGEADCAILDDYTKASALAEQNPARYDALVARCPAKT
ncbi:MAG TPA: hypothetical protein VIT92_15590 [Burkholderiaceae bacterium]